MRPNGRQVGPITPVQMYLPSSRTMAPRLGSVARMRPTRSFPFSSPPRPLGLPYKLLWGGSVDAIRPRSTFVISHTAASHRILRSESFSARSHGEVLPDRQRRVPGGRREGQAQAPRAHRREELRPPHAPSRVSPHSLSLSRRRRYQPPRVLPDRRAEFSGA